jgi:hypothetical protein
MCGGPRLGTGEVDDDDAANAGRGAEGIEILADLLDGLGVGGHFDVLLAQGGDLLAAPAHHARADARFHGVELGAQVVGEAGQAAVVEHGAGALAQGAALDLVAAEDELVEAGQVDGPEGGALGDQAEGRAALEQGGVAGDGDRRNAAPSSDEPDADVGGGVIQFPPQKAAVHPRGGAGSSSPGSA